MCGVPADIAEHKKPERRDDAIFNQTSELTWMLEPDGTIVVANRAALAFGVPAGQWR